MNMANMKNERRFIGYFMGVLTMILLSIIGITVLPIFILNEYFPIEYTRGFVIISMGIAAFVGTLITSYCIGEEGRGRVIITVAAYDILLVLSSLLFFGNLSGRLIYVIGAGFVGYFATWLLRAGQKKPHSKRKKKKRNG